MKIRDPEDVLRKYPHQMSGGMLQLTPYNIRIHMPPHMRIANVHDT